MVCVPLRYVSVTLESKFRVRGAMCGNDGRDAVTVRVRVRVSKCVTLLKGENENRYRDKAVEAVSEARACRKSRRWQSRSRSRSQAGGRGGGGVLHLIDLGLIPREEPSRCAAKGLSPAGLTPCTSLKHL